MFNQFTTWFQNLVVRWFTAVTNWIHDGFIWLVDGILHGVEALFNSIPVPSWVSGGLSAFYNSMPPGIVWALDQMGMVQALAIIGTGYLFRLTRKLITLGQW